MLNAKKIRIYPNERQRILLAKNHGCYRLVYNTCLSHCINSYKEGKTNVINLKYLGKYFTDYIRKNPEKSFMLEQNTKVMKQAIIDLIQAYKNFFDSCSNKRKGEKVGFPKFKKKFDRQRSRFPVDAVSKKCLSDKNNKLNLTKEIKNLKYRCSDSDKNYLLKNKQNIKSVTISKATSGKYFASILVGQTKTKLSF